MSTAQSKKNSCQSWYIQYMLMVFTLDKWTRCLVFETSLLELNLSDLKSYKS